MLRLTPDGGVRFEGSGDGPDSQPPRKLETRHTPTSSQHPRSHLINEVETLIEPLGSGESIPTAQQFSPEELEKIGEAVERMRREQDTPEAPPPARKQLDPMQDEVQLNIRKLIQSINEHQKPLAPEERGRNLRERTEKLNPTKIITQDIVFFLHRFLGNPWQELQSVFGERVQRVIQSLHAADGTSQWENEAETYRLVQKTLIGNPDTLDAESYTRKLLEQNKKKREIKAKMLLKRYGTPGLRFHILSAALIASQTSETPHRLPQLEQFRELTTAECLAIEHQLAKDSSLSSAERMVCLELLHAWNDHFSGMNEATLGNLNTDTNKNIQHKHWLYGLPPDVYNKKSSNYPPGKLPLHQEFIPARLVDTNGVHSELLYTKYVHIPDGTELTLTNTSSLEQGEGTELILPPDYLGETELRIKLVSKNGRIAFYFPANTKEEKSTKDVKDADTWIIGTTTVRSTTLSEAPDYRALQIQTQHGTLTLELHPRGVTLSMKRKTSL